MSFISHFAKFCLFFLISPQFALSGSDSNGETFATFPSQSNNQDADQLYKMCKNEIGGHEVIQGMRRGVCIAYRDGTEPVAGKFIPELNQCRFLQDVVETKKAWCKFLLPSNGRIQWIGTTASTLPKDIIPIKAGLNVYACRIARNGDLVVGTLKKGSDKCVAAHKKQEISSTHFEVRVRSRLGVLLQRIGIK